MHALLFLSEPSVRPSRVPACMCFTRFFLHVRGQKVHIRVLVSWAEDLMFTPTLCTNDQVVSIREQLLGEDGTGCLQLLMRYPPDQSVATVISLSLWVQALAASERLAQPQSSPAVTFGREMPLERQLESARVRLNRAGRETGGVSVYSPSTSQSAGRGAERRRSGSGAGVGRQSRPIGRDQRLESERETRNNWHQGLDDFTRRYERAP